MESVGDIMPVLTTASRAERATLRAAREMARRDAAQGRAGRVDLDDGLAMSTRQLDRLTGAHRIAYETLDWRRLAAREPLPFPVRTHERERAARHALATYQPSWHDRLLAEEAHRRRQLTWKVAEAASADEAAFQRAYRAVEAQNAETLFARRLVNLDPQAMKEAILRRSKLAELTDCMNSLGLAQPSAGRVVAVVDGLQFGDMPLERIAVSAAGGAEPIPIAERRRMHLANVCATALRVGAELVSVLPLHAVEVVVECDAEPRGPILQLLMTAERLANLELKTADAVSLATSIQARMDWSLENGFAPIRPIPLSAVVQPLARSA